MRPLLTSTLMVGALAIGAFLLPSEANGMMACGERTIIVDRLAAKFDEQRASLMIDHQGNLVKVFANPETGTWTLLITRPGGSTCVVSSGQDYVNTARPRVGAEI
jgi:hypothetical protein